MDTVIVLVRPSRSAYSAWLGDGGNSGASNKELAGRFGIPQQSDYSL
jgi:hypothetical protein